MAETYHGVEIPEDIWLSWNDPNSSEASAWRRGVRDAKQPHDDAEMTESIRLTIEAQDRDEEDQRVWRLNHGTS